MDEDEPPDPTALARLERDVGRMCWFVFGTVACILAWVTYESRV